MDLCHKSWDLGVLGVRAGVELSKMKPRQVENLGVEILQSFCLVESGSFRPLADEPSAETGCKTMRALTS
jgi:hypothetical protein